MKPPFFLVWACVILSSCTLFRTPEPPPAPRPPQAGIIRHINRPEHYFVFESERRIPPGTELRIVRNGRKIGSARVVSMREKKFQVADILSGAPVPGDFCEPQITQLPVLEPQTGQ